MKLLHYLSESKATPEFAECVRLFISESRANGRIEYSPGAPPVKIARTLTKVLEAYPDSVIERVAIDARSGCEFFRGEIEVTTSERTRRIEFHWDCRWKAEELGWKDYFGFPDQLRAAREYGHDCFRNWDEIGVEISGAEL